MKEVVCSDKEVKRLVRSRAIHLEKPLSPMYLADLIEICPFASVEIKFVEDGAWKLVNITKQEHFVPAGPVLCYEIDYEGADLGIGYQ